MSTEKFIFRHDSKNPTLEKYTEEAQLNSGDRLLYIHIPPPETLNLSEKPGILLLMDGNQEIISGSNYDSTPDVLDKMYKKSEIPSQVTVFIPEAEDRIKEYACNPDFTEFLSNQLVPLLKTQFNCSNEREQTTIAGSSFGGLAATHAALTHPEVFGNCISQSGAYWWSNQWQGFDENDDWKNGKKTQALESTKKALSLDCVADTIRQSCGKPAVNFYLSGGEVEEKNTPSLQGESFPGAISLNDKLRPVLEAAGHKVAVRKITEDKDNPLTGDHGPCSWQKDKEKFALKITNPEAFLAIKEELEKEYIKLSKQKQNPETDDKIPELEQTATVSINK
ncbi:alpha/beta hydrolase [Legionella sainthelensi]|uniref:Ferric enterobactin esterase n=1 Tax=Legionella sainthelensi TaxID=28087 RepID=A0A2H5FM10_9GAMM|nr:alpha/beta hydrolase-fold protein [Legionella sainthelensi]AUH72573.1 esterase family protein [Legionella sainthelensi]